MLTNQYTLAAVRAQIIDYLTSWNLKACGVCRKNSEAELIKMHDFFLNLIKNKKINMEEYRVLFFPNDREHLHHCLCI